ncbi:MAG: hypothetical protein ACFHWZ_09705 [Phycisphaerales bacterium]
MQRTTRNLPARLHRGRVLSAAVLTASALLLATAPQAAAQDGVWAHYDVTEPKVITLEFDTDLLAFDLCWSDHTDMVKEQIVNGAIAQMNDPTQLHVIRMPGLPPFYRRTSNAPVWHDLTGGVITSSDVLPNRASYHIDVEQALIEIAGRIRAERPARSSRSRASSSSRSPAVRRPTRNSVRCRISISPIGRSTSTTSATSCTTR